MRCGFLAGVHVGAILHTVQPKRTQQDQTTPFKIIIELSIIMYNNDICYIISPIESLMMIMNNINATPAPTYPTPR